MDRNSPESYCETSPQVSLDNTKTLITYIRNLPSTLVYPIITPRFAISCSDGLLTSLGKLASSEKTIAIQTHISENKSEIQFTKELFPNCTSYADVYDHFGLLRDNTVLAHAVHLDDSEKALIKERNAGISHCPTSNFNLSSGVAPIGEYLDMGIKVGLGTDVSGGFSTSILQAVQLASVAAKVKAMQSTGVANSNTGFANRALSISTLLYLATLGGAEVCCLTDRIGSFHAGKEFDALLVDIRDRPVGGNPGLWGETLLDTVGPKEKLETSLERFLFTGDDRNIRQVFVKGVRVAGFAT
jgi:guanine deaminase